jgi:hypothetical protein
MLFTLAASYDLNDYLRTAAGYRMLYVADREMDLEFRQRLHTDLSGRYTLFDVDLSLRVRLQYGFGEMMTIGEFGNNSLTNRNRLKADYHIFGTRISLFALAEAWGPISDNMGRFLKRMRYSAGATYTLNFQSELVVRYMLEDEINQVAPDQAHILLFGYHYSF